MKLLLLLCAPIVAAHGLGLTAEPLLNYQLTANTWAYNDLCVCEHMLSILRLFSLEERRLCGDLIATFQ